MFSKVLSFITNPFADIVGGWQARKTIAAETAANEAVAESNLKIARFNAKAERIKTQDSSDMSYDMQVLMNRAMGIMDDILIACCLVIVGLHFVPDYAPVMLDGWVALAKAPWWFQFAMLLILVSTLGGFRLLRLVLDKVKDSKFGFLLNGGKQ